MNPIKSPQEMLLEQAGIPHLAGGKAVSKFASKGAELLFNDFVKKATRFKGAPLNAEELALVEKHVGTLSQPTSPALRSGMSAEPRAFHELRTDPNLISPEDVRDPLVVKAYTGRAKSGTKLNPQTEDVHGTQELFEKEARLNQLPQEEARVQRAAAGEYPAMADEGMHPGIETRDIPVSESTWAPSLTPSSDAFAKMSDAVRAEALAKNFGRTNKSLYEVLIANFEKANGRKPDADELNALIAAYNPERHQLTEIGKGIVTDRPHGQKGMENWKEQARLSGLKETYVGAHPSDYSKELKNELALSRGEVPEVKDRKEYKLRPSRPDLKPVETYMEGDVPVSVYPAVKKEGGQITPNEMLHMMLAYGHEPQKFKEGSLAVPEQTFAGYAVDGYKGLKSNIGNAAAKVAGHPASKALGSALGAANKYALAPAFRGLNAYGVYEDANDIYDRLAREDYRGAGISGIGALANLASMRAGLPGMIAGTGISTGANLLNEYLDAKYPHQGRSVLEGTKLKDFE